LKKLWMGKMAQKEYSRAEGNNALVTTDYDYAKETFELKE